MPGKLLYIKDFRRRHFLQNIFLLFSPKFLFVFPKPCIKNPFTNLFRAISDTFLTKTLKFLLKIFGH